MRYEPVVEEVRGKGRPSQGGHGIVDGPGTHDERILALGALAKKQPTEELKLYVGEMSTMLAEEATIPPLDQPNRNVAIDLFSQPKSGKSSSS